MIRVIRLNEHLNNNSAASALKGKIGSNAWKILQYIYEGGDSRELEDIQSFINELIGSNEERDMALLNRYCYHYGNTYALETKTHQLFKTLDAYNVLK